MSVIQPTPDLPLLPTDSQIVILSDLQEGQSVSDWLVSWSLSGMSGMSTIKRHSAPFPPGESVLLPYSLQTAFNQKQL